MFPEEPIRLAGFGGAALFVRHIIVPAPGVEASASPFEVAFDISLHSPQSHSSYFSRVAQEGFLEAFADFCLVVAAADSPEASVPNLRDEKCGFDISVISSDATRVGLLVQVARDLEASPIDWDAMDFETSRAAMAQASLDAREHLEFDAWSSNVEIPQDWE